MDKQGVNPQTKEHLLKCSRFHTFSAPGLLIGVYMTEYALELLKAQPDEILYAVSETHKCAPDALQIIAGCTVGNNRLRVIPIGRFAITINRKSWDPEVEGVRVFVDLNKLKQYPIINAWFTNDPSFDHHGNVMPLLDEIFIAGRKILSYEKVMVQTEIKKKWKSVTCTMCGETVPDYLAQGDLCISCAGTNYFRKISI
ncbi:FmdE family protein [Methanocalculus taiwanensis]|nr:FmdE family protein [Methanocalculus taiwanensis]